MKIVYVGHYSGLHGAERCFYESIFALKLKGVQTLAVLPDRGPLCNKLDEIQSPYVFHSLPRWVDFSAAAFTTRVIVFGEFLKATRYFVSLFQREKPHAVVTNTIVVSPCAAIAATFLGIPHIWYIHEFGREDHGLYYYFNERWIHRIISWLSRVVITNSREVRKKYVKDIPKEKVILSKFAIEVKEEPLVYESLSCPNLGPKNPLRIVFVGKICPPKGQEEAVKAIRILRERGYHLTLSLIGGHEVDYRKRIEDLIKRYHLRNEVLIHEFTDDPHEQLRSHHLALVCSRKEAFGRVTVEAMKLGKPVVGSRAGATPELINPYFNGLLYSPGEPSDLANKIAYFCDNPEQIGIMGENARKWAWKNFNMENHGEELYRLLERIT